MNKPKPIPKENIDLDYIIDQCEEYIKFINRNDYSDPENNDMEYYVFNAVMESVFGPEVTEYISNKVHGDFLKSLGVDKQQNE